MLSEKCKLHLEEVGETGTQHLLVAWKTAFKLQLLVPALLIHGVAPRFFTHTASNVVKNILKTREK